MPSSNSEAEPRHRKRRSRSRSRSRGRHERHNNQIEHRERRHHHRHKADMAEDSHRRTIKQEPYDRGYEQAERAQRRERSRNDQRREHNHRNRDQGNPFRSSEGEEFGTAPVKKEKEKPSFEVSGKLAEDTNTFRGVVIKYNEPPEARKPRKRWRLYGFKADEALPTLPVHRQSAYLLGRDRLVADIPVDHPSCSKQHAVLQFKMQKFEREDSTVGRRVRPYIIDLNSTNGTYVNGARIDPQRYMELYEKDVLKFGFSSREFVLLHEGTDTSELHDDEGVD